MPEFAVRGHTAETIVMYQWLSIRRWGAHIYTCMPT